MSDIPDFEHWEIDLMRLKDAEMYEVQILDLDIYRDPPVKWIDGYLKIQNEDGSYLIQLRNGTYRNVFKADGLRNNPFYQKPYYPKLHIQGAMR